MNRAGIIPPAVTITADDKRLKKGKLSLDPLLLAADCLGYDPKNCVIFEDSPSGIRAGGATVIVVCTSHERSNSKIENCGAHYVVVENTEGATSNSARPLWNQDDQLTSALSTTSEPHTLRTSEFFYILLVFLYSDQLLYFSSG
jgi:hypothetical protein